MLEAEAIEKKDVYFPTTTGGAESYFNVRGVPLIRDGEVIGAIMSHEGITERVRAQEKLEYRVEERTAELSKANEQLNREIKEHKRAEEKLHESEERFRSLVELTSDWIWEVNKNGIFTYADPKVKDFLGYEPEEVVGKPYNYFMTEDSKKRHMEIAAIMPDDIPRGLLHGVQARDKLPEYKHQDC